MISLDSPQEMSMPGWFLPDDGGEEGRGVVVLLWVMLCKYDTRPPVCHTSIHIPHLQIAPYSHPFPYTSIHIWICRNIDIFQFKKKTFSCRDVTESLEILLMWSLWVKIPTEYWHEPLNVSQRQKAEKYVKSTSRQGRSKVLVAASAWWARVTFVLLSELDGLPAGLLNLVEHLQQESIVTIVRHPFWRQNLNQTKNISGAQELTPFHFRFQEKS